MRELSVRNFSCIKDATLEFNRLTVLIGPQASGKSVICKLGYFFIDVLKHQSKFIVQNAPVDAFRDFVAEKFKEWFPISAWGSGKFVICFSAGDYKITLTRISYNKKVSEKFRIKFSEKFLSQYAETRALAIKTTDKVLAKGGGYDYEREWRVRELTEKSCEKLLGKDYESWQMFIPAGRSFFTSIGKAVAAFEQGRVLDPLIIQFGRIFTAYKDRSLFMSDDGKDGRMTLEDAFSKLLGGRLIVSGDHEYVECTDGRRVPLSALSSGQQELLPLAAVLPKTMRRGPRKSLYIEEPEAHLFPSAQSKLVEIFATMTGSPGGGTDLVLTTHSPYVLVKINNLIKAGQLGRSHSDARRKKVQNIVPRAAWLGAKMVHAYAIQDGILRDIVNEDGLINGDYLDDVSGEIAKEFMALLETELAE